ncbi:MAG: M23 family metallopeptidase, partial [Actinomycetia bacterium]|nr:M23 family metallopeptidase [Actinomycetes bacterium]
MQVLLSLAVAAALSPLSSSPCPRLALYEPVQIVRPYGPTGRWSGHFGVDIANPGRTPVRSVGAGTVSFVGKVAGRLSVTIDHGGGIRTSYSYLTSALVTRGRHLERGAKVGYAGVH